MRPVTDALDGFENNKKILYFGRVYWSCKSKMV